MCRPSSVISTPTSESAGVPGLGPVEAEHHHGAVGGGALVEIRPPQLGVDRLAGALGLLVQPVPARLALGGVGRSDVLGQDAVEVNPPGRLAVGLDQGGP